MSDPIAGLVMPKWGLSMTEGLIVSWLVAEGETVALGDQIAEVDTDKIVGEMEATTAGVVRRIVAPEGSRYRVGALLAVVADESVDDAAIDAFVAEFPEPAADGADESEAASPYEMLSVGDVQVRCSRLGDGPPLVLIHGFGGDLDNWLFNLTALAEHASLIALDLPGHGASSLAIPDPSPAGLARFVWSALDALDVTDPVALIGHSMGGAIAATMAIEQPQRARSVALIASAGLGPEINQTYIDGFVAARSKREMKDVATALFADPSAVTRALIDGMLRYKRLDGVVPVLTALRDAWFVGGAQRVDVAAALAATALPTLVVWGADDQVVPSAHAAAADDFAAVHVLDGAGHMVQMERANDVNRLLVAHLAPTS